MLRLATALLMIAAGVACAPEDHISTDSLAVTGAPPTPTGEANVETSLARWIDPPPSTETPETDTGGLDGPVVFGRGPLAVSETALMVGALRLVEDCLFVEERSGDGSTTQLTMIIWRHGTTWDDSSATVVTPRGERLAIGGDVELGGGYHPLGSADRDVGNIDGVNHLRECSKRLDTVQLFVE